MQQTTLLESMIRDVLIFKIENGMPRQQGVAMVGQAASGVTAIRTLHVQGSGE